MSFVKVELSIDQILEHVSPELAVKAFGEEQLLSEIDNETIKKYLAQFEEDTLAS